MSLVLLWGLFHLQRGLAVGVKIVKKLPEFGKSLKNNIKSAMPQIAMYLQSCADKKISRGVPPANAPLTQAVKGGSKTLRDNGNLAASIAPHYGDDWADASTKAKQAKILQEGGTITSKGKGLWIPAGSETRKLMRRYSATQPGQLISLMKADGWKMWKQGKAFMAQKGKTSAFVLFIIKNSVKIPARPFLYISDAEERKIDLIIRDAVFKSLKED